MKKTELRDAIIGNDGLIDIYINLIELEPDGVTVKAAHLHSIKIEPDSDMAERLAAVNASVVSDLGFPAITAAQWASAVGYHATAYPAEIKSAYSAWKGHVSAVQAAKAAEAETQRAVEQEAAKAAKKAEFDAAVAAEVKKQLGK